MPLKLNASNKNRKFSWSILRWVVTFGLLALVLTQVDISQLGSVLQDAHWGWIVLATGAMFADRVIATVRWWLLLRVTKVEIGFASLLNLHMAASFVGGFLPTSFGVDAARIVMLSNRTGKILDTVSASTVDRIVMIFVTMAAAALMSASFISTYVPTELRWAVVLLGIAALTSVLIALALGRSSLVEKIARAIVSQRIGNKAAALYGSIISYRQRPALLLAVVGISAFMVLFRACIFIIIARTFDVDVPIIAALLLWPILSVILMLPISVGNFGLQEGTYVAIMGLLHVSPAVAVSMSLLDHMVTRVVLLPGAALWLFGAVPPAVASQSSEMKGDQVSA